MFFFVSGEVLKFKKAERAYQDQKEYLGNFFFRLGSVLAGLAFFSGGTCQVQAERANEDSKIWERLVFFGRISLEQARPTEEMMIRNT